MSSKSTVTRRYDLDWLRVLVILVVFVFHSGRFFDEGGWHVKNPVHYAGVQIWTEFLASWMMPLIFVISGASLFYALDKGSAGKFIKDKVLRLLVPLIVGVFTHISLQVYLERLTQRQFSGSYFEFLPHYFEGLYAFGGNFAWMGLHLWYLMVLFLFSLIFLPLFYLLKGAGRGVLNGLAGFLARPGLVYLLALPVSLALALLDPAGQPGSREWGGWMLVPYIPFFLSGFVIVAGDRLQASIRRLRWVSLLLGVALLAALVYLRSGSDPHFGTPRYTLVFGLFGLHSWCWILAILGFGMKHLTFSTPFLKYAGEAVLPFYILHQTVLLGLGYLVVQWAIPDLLKFGVIAVSSLALIMVLYEFLVRRNNVMRFLFGMKPLRPTPRPVIQTALPPMAEPGH
ncbi:MAG: acyltransferase [Chloroflexota bacterium]